MGKKSYQISALETVLKENAFTEEELKRRYDSRLDREILRKDGSRISFRKQFDEASGHELTKNFWSYVSSSRIAFELYSWIANEPECKDFAFEKKLPGIKSGNKEYPPNMDVFIETKDKQIWFIESKFTERPDPITKLPQAYYVKDDEYISTAGNETRMRIVDRFRNHDKAVGPFTRFCEAMFTVFGTEQASVDNAWFDAKQEICHLFGILMYILENGKTLAGYRIHFRNIVFQDDDLDNAQALEFIAKGTQMILSVLEADGLNEITFDYGVSSSRDLLSQYGSKPAFANGGKTVRETIIENFNGIEEFLHCRSNFFKEMFNFGNERYLHSSFIAMLLSQDDRRYLQLFLKDLSDPELLGMQLGKAGFTLDQCFPDKFAVKIHPNKEDHREKNHVDILIKCEETKSVIIIENKTFSSDRNVNLGGKVVPQLKRYEEPYKGYSNVLLVYLTLRGIKPTCLEQFGQSNLICVGYDKFLIHWIESCIRGCKDAWQRSLLMQYLVFLKENLDTERNAMRQIAKYRKDIDEGYDEKAVFNAFDADMRPLKKDVKFHILYPVFSGILSRLSQSEGVEIEDYDRQLFDEVCRLQNEEHPAKAVVFNFTYQGLLMYLCFDHNGISIGRCDVPQKERLKGTHYFVLKHDDIRRFDSYTFSLLDKNESEELFKSIERQLPDCLEKLL